METADSKKQIDRKQHHYGNSTQSRNIEEEAATNTELGTWRKGRDHRGRQRKTGKGNKDKGKDLIREMSCAYSSTSPVFQEKITQDNRHQDLSWLRYWLPGLEK